MSPMKKLIELARATASERPDGREDTAGLDCFRKMMSFISFVAWLRTRLRLLEIAYPALSEVPFFSLVS